METHIVSTIESVEKYLADNAITYRVSLYL
jgi:hypothetical protein